MRLRPAYADAYTGMGVALKELKRRDEAEACFAQVVRLRPGCALSLGNLAGAPAAWALSVTHNKLLGLPCGSGAHLLAGRARVAWRHGPCLRRVLQSVVVRRAPCHCSCAAV